MAPRKPEQFEELREKSKEKILAAAMELFAINGYTSTSISSIAQKAGISKGLIYNYFDSKKSILLAIYQQAMEEAEGMINRYHDLEPYERLRRLIEDVFMFYTEHFQYYKLLTALSLQPGVLADIPEYTNEMTERGMAMMVELLKSTGNEDPETNGVFLGALMDGIGLGYIVMGDKYPLEKIKAKIIKDFCTPKTK